MLKKFLDRSGAIFIKYCNFNYLFQTLIYILEIMVIGKDD